MKLISNHLLTLSEFSNLGDDIVIRINLAHVKDKGELNKFLAIPNDVFLDYPRGRTKPPIPKLELEETMALVKKYKNIKYFAVSNFEESEDVKIFSDQLPSYVKLVPKIETARGVMNLEDILDQGVEYVMLDGQDLYTDIANNHMFLKAKTKVKELCFIKSVNLLELYGVVFCS